MIDAPTRFRHWGVGIVVVLLLFATDLLVVRPAAAQTPGVITVCQTGDCDFTNVQDAAGFAADGDTIKIAAGEYKNANMTVEGRFLTVDKNLTLLGGYEVGSWDLSDPEANPTVLNGEWLGPVLYAQTAGITLTVEGLTVKYGLGQGIYVNRTVLNLNNAIVRSTISSPDEPIGIHLDDSDGSEIRNTRISGNIGKGIYLTNNNDTSGNVTLANNVITANKTGIYFESYNDFATLEGNEIVDNSGPGVYLYRFNDNVTFTDNHITGNSPGIYVSGSRDVTFTGNRIVGNGSAGLTASGSNYNFTLQNNTIADNNGEGIVSGAAYNWVLDNNFIVRNRRDGIEWTAGGNAILHHNTISDNSTAVYDDAGISVHSASLVLTNTIISGQDYGIRTLDPRANVLASHTLWHDNSSANTIMSGGEATIVSTDNVTGDPQFLGGSDAFDAYHLQAGSPAIDAGAESDLGVDIDGENRAPDIGADEYPYVLSLTSAVRGTVEADTTVVYTHTLRNSGGLTDTVSLSALSSQGWPVSVVPTAVTLGSGELIEVVVTLTVPSETSGQANTTTVTALSDGEPSTQTILKDVAFVGMGVSLEPDSSQTVEPGSVVTYTHTLLNSGVEVEVFDLSVNSNQGWASLADAGPITLNSGESALVRMRVLVPLSTAAGIIDTAVVTATLSRVAEVLDTAQNTTTVSAPAGTRHVATTGDDVNNSCLSDIAPCRTVQYAYEQAQSGDTIKIAAGEYKNANMAVEGRFLTVDKNLILSGGYAVGSWDLSDPEANPTVLSGEWLGPVLYAQTPGITLTVDGLIIKYGRNQGIYVNRTVLILTNGQVVSTIASPDLPTGVYLNDSDGSEIRRIRIAGNNGYGIYLTNNNDTSGNVTLANNVITANKTGVYFESYNDFATLEGNEIVDNSGPGVYLYRYNDNIAFTDNRITGNGSPGLHIGYSNYATLAGNQIVGNGSPGFQASGSNSNFLIQNNTIADNSGEGILADTTNGWVLDNNFIVRNGRDGIKWTAGGNAILRHNTISDNSVSTNLDAGISVHSARLVLTNTIISGQDYGIRTLDPRANVQASHTLWHDNSSANTENSAGGTITLSNEFNGDPRFAGATDPFDAFHLVSDSAALDVGIDVGPIIDIDGDERPIGDGFDLGADEYPGGAIMPVGLTVVGQEIGELDTRYTFTATVHPISTTLPITYGWTATGQDETITHVANLQDGATFIWHEPGTHQVVVTASNDAGMITSSHGITTVAPVAAGFPFSDTFETGLLSPIWRTKSGVQGRVQVSDVYPFVGNYSVLLDNRLDDEVLDTAELILTIDLASQPHAILDFWWHEFNDDDHVQDGVFISDDYGRTWHQAFSFNNGPNAYQRQFIDLGAAASAGGQTFNDHFQIKFQFNDNQPIPSDGYAIDNVQVVSPNPFDAVAITGPTEGISLGSYNFTAEVSPATATPPITYRWEATGQAPLTQSGDLDSDVSFTWNDVGIKTITVTASSAVATHIDVHEITVSASPAVSAEPALFNINLSTGEVTTRTLAVGNDGPGDLSFDLNVTNVIADLDPLNGTVIGPGQTPIAVTFDAIALPAGVHSGEIRITSNDPVTPVLAIPVTLNVTLAPPETPSTPDPADGETGVRVDSSLVWQSSYHASSYDLYLWEDGQSEPGTPTADGLTQASYDPSGDLPTNTLFRWRVVARNAAGETSGPTWTFATETLPDLQVVALTVPMTATSGALIDASWTVTNAGDGVAASWGDRVYLSSNPTFDPGTATYLAEIGAPMALTPNTGYNQVAGITLPNDALGLHYLFVVVDGSGSVREQIETNNTSGPSNAINITPIPADLSVAKTALAHSNQGISSSQALSGGAITYTLSVANNGQVAAANVLLTDTLPAGVTYVSHSSGAPFVQNGNILTWQLGQLAAGSSLSFELVGTIDGAVSGEIINQADVSTSSYENDLTNNSAQRSTQVEAPRPVLSVSPSGPTIVVLQGTSVDLSVTVQNTGAAPMIGITVTPPPHIGWVSVDSGGLTQLQPGESADITVTATASDGQTPGLYRDFVTVVEASGGSEVVALTVKVIPPRRSLAVMVQNDQGATVASASLQLVKQDAYVIETEGSVQTYQEHEQGATDGTGLVAFNDLDVGAYDYTLSAVDHESATGTLTVIEGGGSQNETLILTALAEMSLLPATPVIGVVRGETAGQTIRIVNNGAAPLTGVAITPPNLSWVTLGAPQTIDPIAPGAHVDFTVFASPTTDLALGVYQDAITVSADGGQSRQAALTVEVTDTGARDLTLSVVDDSGTPVTEGSVSLTEQAFTVQNVEGKEVTFNQHHSAVLDATGAAHFTGLAPGAYNYLVAAQGYEHGAGTVSVTPGNGLQTSVVILNPAPFTYEWQVTPVDDEYDITLTLTYDAGSGDTPATLVIPPRFWSFRDCAQEITDHIRVYNPTLIPLDLVGLTISVPGVHVDVDPAPVTIEPGGFVLIPVTAIQSGSVGIGATSATFNYVAVDDEYVSFTFNPGSVISPVLEPGETYNDSFVLEPVVFDPTASYTLTVGTPNTLDWISASTRRPGPLTWTTGMAIPVDLIVDAPVWLSEGVYTDTIDIGVSGSEGTARAGELVIEVTKAANGLQVHTSFQLGPIPYIDKVGVTTGNIYAISSTCDSPTTDPDGGWTWDLIRVNDDPQTHLQGTRRDTGQPAPAFPQTMAPPTHVYDHQEVRLEIDQKVMLEGEGFDASLTLDNISGSPVEVVSVDIQLFDEFDVDQTSGFTLIPGVPTDLGTVPVSGSATGDWLILPNDLGVSAPEGKEFEVVAVIDYTWNGNNYSVETVPEIITVYPAPKLVITYELPPPECVSTVFDIKTTIENQGLGPARNLRFISAQPHIVENRAGLPIGFEITEAFVDDDSRSESLELNLGDLPAGQHKEVFWHLESSLPGRLVEFTSDYRQANYQGVSQTPLISQIKTVFRIDGNVDCVENSRLKPPLLVVHGIQTLEFLFAVLSGDVENLDDIDDLGYRCRSDSGELMGPLEFDGLNGTLEPLPAWFVEDYNVWIAKLDAGSYLSKTGTPSLEDNGICLRDQINVMYESLTPAQKEQKITIVAHSMGGLVSRVCLKYPECRSKVRALYTMGSPHGGLNWEYIVELLNSKSITVDMIYGLLQPILEGEESTRRSVEFCGSQVGLCDMDSIQMTQFNIDHPNQPNIDYVFIGGGGLNPYTGANPTYLYFLVAPEFIPAVVASIAFMALEGSHDGVVTRKSGIGWASPLTSFFPDWWTSNSGKFAQYWTDEVHEETFADVIPELVIDGLLDDNHGYYSARLPVEGGTDEGRSQSYACIAYEEGLEGHEFLPVNCQLVSAQDFTVDTMAATAEADVLDSTTLTSIRNEDRLYEYSSSIHPVPLDTDGSSLFATTWTTGTLNVSLMRPDGIIIDPDFATNNPNEVSLNAAAGTDSVPPSLSYYFTDTLAGTWQLIVSADEAPDIGIRYMSTAYFESSRVLSIETDAGSYRPGETATLTATLTSNDMGIGGVEVQASIVNAGGITDTVSYQEIGPGIYVSTYTVPSIAGYTTYSVSATGTDGNTAFSRSSAGLWSVAPEGATFGPGIIEEAIDLDDDGLFDELRISVEINVSRPISVVVGAHLIKHDSLISSTATDAKFQTNGLYSVQLVFDGDDIRRAGLAGPFTVSNVRLTDVEFGGAAVDEWASPYTTAAYNAQFSVAAVEQVDIVGANLANVRFAVPFTATVAPIATSQPITYVWQATDQMPITRTNGISDTAVFTWTASGTKLITVTAINESGSVSDTHTIVIDAGPPAMVTVSAVPDSIAANGASTSTVTAAVVDDGINPVAGQTVTFTTSLGGVVPLTATTDAGGLVTATVTSAATPGVATVLAAAGSITDTILVTFTEAVSVITAVNGVTIEGATTGDIGTSYIFTATTTPITATMPITYVWQATDRMSITQTNGISDTAVFTWTTPGEKIISLTATNAGGSAFTSHAVTVSVPAPETGLTGTFTIQGRSEHDVEVSIRLYEVGAATPSYVFTPTATITGQFAISGISSATYEVAVKHATSLQVVDTLTIADGANSHDFGQMQAGDINNDNRISTGDVSVLATSFNTLLGDAEYDARADFNNDGRIATADVSLLADNFNLVGEKPSGTP